MKVYISGPITGIDGYKDVFASYQCMLEDKGYAVVNPATIDVPEWTWTQYMQYDLAMLRGCDYIFMLPGWTHSKGARIERRYAKRLGIRELVV